MVLLLYGEISFHNYQRIDQRHKASWSLLGLKHGMTCFMGTLSSKSRLYL